MQPWPPASIPPRRAAGSPSAPAAFLALSRLEIEGEDAKACVSATDFNKEVTETSAEWIADGNCCCTADI